MATRSETNTALMTVNVGGVDVYSIGGGLTGSKRTIILKELVVEKKLDAPDSFRLRYGAQDMGKRLVHEGLKEGKEVEIKVGYGKAEPIFKGEVSYITATFGAGQEATMEVSGFDRSHRLTRGSRSRTWGDGMESQVRYADVFSEVISQAKADEGSTSDSLSVGEAKPDGPTVTYVPQLNMNDYQFIKSLGADIDHAVDSDSTNDDRQILFRKVDVAGKAVVSICFDKLKGEKAVRGQTARFRVSTVRQVAKVIVRGWDAGTKKTIIGEAMSPTLNFGVSPGHQVAGQAHWGGASEGKTVVVTDHPVESKEEADALAQALFDQYSMDFVHAEAEVLGSPSIEPGALIEFIGYGEAFDGKYLVLECTHVFVAGVKNYYTRVVCARNGANGVV